MARGQQTLTWGQRKALGDTIKTKRGARSVSVLAPLAGIQSVTWRKYESGESSPSLASLAAIAKALGCKPSVLCRAIDVDA